MPQQAVALGSEDLDALVHPTYRNWEADATGRPFHQSQSHWFRLADGQIAEHWANRGDLGFLHQVGAAPGARVGGR